jgi:hypothetical protein
MPKQGVAKCNYCGLELQGIFPDDKPTGQTYFSAKNEITDTELLKKVYDHHWETASFKTAGKPIIGHRSWLVTLEDGTFGRIDSGSCMLFYKETGKERG